VLPRVRTARPRGAGRPRASASRSSAKSGDSPSGSSEGGEPPGETTGRPAERGPAPSPRFSRPWRRVDGQVAERLAALDRIGGRR
jgi:hypothetical protein